MTVEVKNLYISNGEFQIFENFNLRLEKGQIATVMGPSGSGKSTLLSFISGTIHGRNFHFNGQVILNNQDISLEPVEKRKVGLLFQDDLLFPHMTVGENLAFALPPGTKRRKRKKIIESYLEDAKLSGFAERYPSTLSGGQRARISLLRTLLSKPQLFLLDEPFSKLDTELRMDFREFTFDFIRELNIPGILVTHDEMDCPRDSTLIKLNHPKKIS